MNRQHKNKRCNRQTRNSDNEPRKRIKDSLHDIFSTLHRFRTSKFSRTTGHGLPMVHLSGFVASRTNLSLESSWTRATKEREEMRKVMPVLATMNL